MYPLLITLALPGKLQQQHMQTATCGQQVRTDAPLVAVHDSARPLVTVADTQRCLQDGYTVSGWAGGGLCKD
jgi:2-C-methyl-D-erythritol 4-phosphate cytidylyltransferase